MTGRAGRPKLSPVAQVEAEQLLALTKRLVGPVTWVVRGGEWLRFQCALEANDQSLEDVRVLMQVRPEDSLRPAKITVNLLFRNRRIYAVDMDPDETHVNGASTNRPWAGKRVPAGVNVHLYVDGREGYCEPCPPPPPDPSDVRGIFELFCRGAGIDPGNHWREPPLTGNLPC